MTTAREVAPNRALSGDEVKDLLRADFELLLSNHGMLSSQTAYGRLAYDLHLKLHLDNFLSPESEIEVKSRPVAGNIMATRSALAAVEGPPPLKEVSPQSAITSRQLHREITSPNAERVRAGMPVPVEVKDADGTRRTESIKYPPDESLGPGDVTVTDTTDQTKSEWKA